MVVFATGILLRPLGLVKRRARFTRDREVSLLAGPVIRDRKCPSLVDKHKAYGERVARIYREQQLGLVVLSSVTPERV